MALLPEDIAGPWAIERSRLDALVRAWRDVDPAKVAGAVTVVAGAIGGERGDTPLYAVDDGIAVIPVTGPLSKAWSWWMAYFGGSSTQRIGAALEQAVVDPAVRGVLLQVDSPGGQVAGTSDLADAIRDAARVKPVHAYIADCGCSAAYWLASQATRITCNTTAQVGSIGVYTVLVDSSEAAKSLGFAVKVIASGALKARVKRARRSPTSRRPRSRASSTRSRACSCRPSRARRGAWRSTPCARWPTDAC